MAGKDLEKQNLMVKAHAVAHLIAPALHNNYQLAISLAIANIQKLKKHYHLKMINEEDVQRISHYLLQAIPKWHVGGVPLWLINQKFNTSESILILLHTKQTFVLKKTAKAVLVQFECLHQQTFKIWCPQKFYVAF